jgi:hypothetical protein
MQQYVSQLIHAAWLYWKGSQEDAQLITPEPSPVSYPGFKALAALLGCTALVLGSVAAGVCPVLCFFADHCVC